MRRYAYIAGTTIAVVIALWAVWYSVEASRAARSMVGIVTAPGKASLQVHDQLGAQGAIRIDRIVVPEASWVVVYVRGMGGMNGARIGLVRVLAGETKALSVPLDSGVRLTDKVIVVLQADRGVPSVFEFDPGRFDASPDKPYFVGGIQLSRPVVVRYSEMGNAV